MDSNPYKMAINNIAGHLRKSPEEEVKAFDAFTASSVLAVAFCKFKEDVLNDILTAGNND